MPATVIEPVEREHPWSRLYAEQGRERPQLVDFSRRPAAAAAKPAAPVPKSIWDEPPPEVELVNARRLAEIAAEIEERRRRDRIAFWRLLGTGTVAVMAVILLVEAWQFFGNDRPAPERLEAIAAETAGLVMTRLASSSQPLALERVEAELVHSASSRRSDYEVLVTVRLRENLFGPAESNGAQPYLQLQRSVREAGDRMRQQRLFLERPDLAAAVELPLLLAPTHRAGERLVVRVPLSAERVGWRWRLQAQPERMRPQGPLFHGRVLADHGNEARLIFGSPEAREAMRPLMNEARRFILAVNAELSARSRRPQHSPAAGQ